MLKHNNEFSIGYVLFGVVFLTLAAIFAWRFERWVNWKLSYGPKVEKRIDALEKRVDRLENGR